MFVQDGMGHADIGRLDTPFVAVERSGPVTSSNMEDACECSILVSSSQQKNLVKLTSKYSCESQPS
jgi:hypothetical protein